MDRLSGTATAKRVMRASARSKNFWGIKRFVRDTEPMTRFVKRTLALTAFLAVLADGHANAEQVLLSCWGTVELIQQGKQANSVNERSSLAVAVDLSRKLITINDVQWPLSGDASRETLVAMDPDKGSVSLNRITGAINVHFIEAPGLKLFYGECKPAQKLF